MRRERDKAKFDASFNAGVPLGGVGAGCIEMGRDGRFRNITINNNRTSRDRIPVSKRSFLAVRAAQRGRVFVRFLQADLDIPFQSAGITPTFTPVEELSWRGLYPRADLRLSGPGFPVEVSWTALAPIIPYDLDASTLPLLFLRMEIVNRSEALVEAATVFNWENLCGCTNLDWPEDRGVIRAVYPETRGCKDEEEAVAPPEPAGLKYGKFESFHTNAQGNYCLLARPEANLEVSVKSWIGTDPRHMRRFWEMFHDEGRLDNETIADPEAQCGAVCCSFQLAPGASHQVLYALAWYCPRFEIDGIDQGNWYARSFEDAHRVAERGMRYHRYFFKAVEDWHRRFLNSSFPSWFPKTLINGSYVFSTNTLLTRDGKFAMFESPRDPRTGALDRRFHSSLGTLLFFPMLAFSELELFAEVHPPSAPGRLYRCLGNLSVHEPHFGGAKGEMMDLNAKFILMVYRDYHLTGRLVDLRKFFPRLGQVLRYVLDKDRNGDGLPENQGFSTTYDHWKFYGIDSYSGSIWLAALRAFEELARDLGMVREAEWAHELFKRAQASFEKRLWNEKGGYYYFHDNVGGKPADDEPVQHGCASGQLAGQWYADFLGLGCLLPPDHIKRALEAIFQVHEQGRTITSWPAFHATHYACLEIRHGNPDRGFHAVQKVYQTVHVRHGCAFNQPLFWNLVTDLPDGWGSDRHMSSLSYWHVLYALEGFLLDLPQQELRLRPHLPRGVHFLEAPLFSPIGFGWLTFRESDEKGVYRQHVRVAFDSPVRVQTVILRVPQPVEEVEVRAEGPEECTIDQHSFGYEGDERLLEIQFKHPITITDLLKIELEQTGGGKVELPRHPQRGATSS